MDYNFKLLNKHYLINNYINKHILNNFPNKEYILKNNIEECMYNNIKYIFGYKLSNNKNVRNKYLNDILINNSMLNYYTYIIYCKKIINNKRYIVTSNFLIEIKKIVYGLIDYEKGL